MTTRRSTLFPLTSSATGSHTQNYEEKYRSLTKESSGFVRSEALTAARLTVHVFRDVTVCSRVSRSGHFEGTECLRNVHTHSSKDTASNLRRHESSLQYLSVYTWFALLPFLRCASATRDCFVHSTLVADTAHTNFPTSHPYPINPITKPRLRFTVTIFHIRYMINSFSPPIFTSLLPIILTNTYHTNFF